MEAKAKYEFEQAQLAAKKSALEGLAEEEDAKVGKISSGRANFYCPLSNLKSFKALRFTLEGAQELSSNKGVL